MNPRPDDYESSALPLSYPGAADRFHEVRSTIEQEADPVNIQAQEAGVTAAGKGFQPRNAIGTGINVKMNKRTAR